MVEIKTMEERKNELLVKGKEQGYITFEQLADALKGLEIDNDSLDEVYNALLGTSFLTEDGIKLGQIVSSIRSGNRKISEDQKAMLVGLGFVWRVK